MTDTVWMLDALTVLLDHRSADLDPAVPPGPERSKEVIMSGPWSRGLEPHLLLEGLYMVAAGIRPASFHHPSTEHEIVLLNGAARELGLGMRVRLSGRRVYKLWLFGPGNGKMVETVPDLSEEMGPREFITAQIAVANLTGRFLRYPECCVSSFIKHLMGGTDQDEEAKEALKDHPAPDPRAYFVERFVPCRPDCPEAIREGKRIEEKLSEMSLDMLAEYRSLREMHMEEVRSGAIIEEKRERDGPSV